MIHSMTAYASHSFALNWGSVTWEIRSVNNRYLDLSFKLPEIARNLEGKFRDIAKNKLNRGKIDCFLRIEFNATAQSLVVDFNLVDSLCSAMQGIEQKIPGLSSASSIDILQWPGILKSDISISKEQVGADISNCFNEVLDYLIQARTNEGDKLVDLINMRLTSMESMVDSVQNNFPQILEKYKQKLRDKVIELVNDADQNHLEQELVHLSSKHDIAEEIERLAIHIKESLRIISNGGVVGRKLDFLMQELNREANTLASKALDSDTSIASVELRVLIEQIREQVQNLQ